MYFIIQHTVSFTSSQQALSFLKKISVVQFRNYVSRSLHLEHRISCISGPNGSGKTNMLDAVYYLCYTKSYLTAYTQNCVMIGANGFRLEGSFDSSGAVDEIVCKWQGGKKEVFLNDVPYEKLTDHIGRYAAVMIAPDDTELINGGSENRRKWMDGILGQTDPSYLAQLLLYQRVLLQRNAWLKQEFIKNSGNFSEIAYYDQILAETGGFIHEQRKAFAASFLPILLSIYQRIAGSAELPTMGYVSELNTQNYTTLLSGSLEQDLRLQRTTKGVHRDDLDLMIRLMPAKQFASQGQKKSLIFALKLAQFEYLKNRLGKPPLLMLDDVFEKLDQLRIEALMDMLKGGTFGQVLLTDTHADRVLKALGRTEDIGLITLT